MLDPVPARGADHEPFPCSACASAKPPGPPANAADDHTRIECGDPGTDRAAPTGPRSVRDEPVADPPAPETSAGTHCPEATTAIGWLWSSDWEAFGRAARRELNSNIHASRPLRERDDR